MAILIIFAVGLLAVQLISFSPSSIIIKVCHCVNFLTAKAKQNGQPMKSQRPARKKSEIPYLANFPMNTSAE
jgi:hypothetical protein